MQPLNTEQMIITDARHMPIVKAYAKRIGLVDTIDRLVDTQMELSPGMAVFGMVLDTLSGRTPLYRFTEFFEEKDTELLLGAAIESDRFCDTNLGRSMDKILETGNRVVVVRPGGKSRCEYVGLSDRKMETKRARTSRNRNERSKSMNISGLNFKPFEHGAIFKYLINLNRT